MIQHHFECSCGEIIYTWVSQVNNEVTSSCYICGNLYRVWYNGNYERTLLKDYERSDLLIERAYYENVILKTRAWIAENGTHWDAGTALFDAVCNIRIIDRKLNATTL